MENRRGYYHYTSDQDGRGQLYGAPINVEDFGVNRTDHQFSLAHYHPNQLQPLGVDEGSASMLYQEYDSNLIDYLATLPPPLEQYSFPACPQPPGYLLRGCYRDIIKSAISYVTDLHDTQKCLGDFGAENIVVANGEIKFKAVRHKSHSTSKVRSDFMRLAKIIDRHILLNAPEGDRPRDLKDLIEVLKMPWPVQQGDAEERVYLLRNHFALMNSVERDSFFMKSHNCKNWIIGSIYWQGYIDAIKGTNIPRRWHKKLGVGHPLRPVYNFGNSYDDGTNTPGPFFKEELIRFFRNATEHMADERFNYTPYLEESQCSKILVLTFPEVPSSFQLKLAENGALIRVMEHEV